MAASDPTGPAGPDFSNFPAPDPPAAADVATELEEFRRYLDKLISSGVGNVSIDAVLVAFRRYQGQLRGMREALRPALESIARGEDTSVPWDRDKFLAEFNLRLITRGFSADRQLR